MSDRTAAHPAVRLRALLRALGAGLLAAGLVALLFVVYEIFGTDMINAHRQDALAEDLRTEWAQGPSGSNGDAAGRATTADEVPVGASLAFLYIPRLGADYRRVVLEGTSEEQLALGPGHYPGTALPGRPGNVAIAGHRVGDGSPFLDLDRLRPGDAIVLETREAWFVYRVLGNPDTGDFAGDPSGIPGRQIVRPEDVEVIAPTPNGPPAAAYLTLTTCHPHFSAGERLVLHATLDGPGLPKANDPGEPDALHEG